MRDFISSDIFLRRVLEIGFAHIGERHKTNSFLVANVAHSNLLRVVNPVVLTVVFVVLQTTRSSKTYGTGSYPLPPQGLQRRILHTVRASPLNGPCFRKACKAYSEHVGVNRQTGGFRGDMQTR